MEMGSEFDADVHYYKHLLQNKGILRSDQVLMDSETTAIWVRIYSANWRLFQNDFGLAMTKLSNLGVLTGTLGEVRHQCSAVN